MILVEKIFLYFLLIFFIGCSSASSDPVQSVQNQEIKEKRLQVGAERLEYYLPKLKGYNIGMVVNQSSLVGTTPLADTLISRGVKVRKIFAPEHGYKGVKGAGETFGNEKDETTAVEVLALYGKTKKLTVENLEGIDLMIFDLQDVGARFYTYISSLHYVMDGCAKAGVPLMIMDRPNPNGHYVAGPILDPAYSSFIGMHPIPIVHGMTIGEYGQMINGEGWLNKEKEEGKNCQLEVITCLNYSRNDPYGLPVRPSPNLPNATSIYLYPSLCFFEGTAISVGRGTDAPFQQFGHPNLPIGDKKFTPTTGYKTKLMNEECRGTYLGDRSHKELRSDKLTLKYLIDAYQAFPEKDKFFTRVEHFDLLAGSDALRKMIIAGKTEAEIKAVWKEDEESFLQQRKPYLLYQ